MIEYLRLTKKIYGNFLRDRVVKEPSILRASLRFIFLIITLPITYFLLIALLYLADSFEKEIKNARDERNREKHL